MMADARRLSNTEVEDLATKGVTDGSVAQAGEIGEELEAIATVSVTSGSSSSVGPATELVSLSLPAGSWLVSGIAGSATSADNLRFIEIKVSEVSQDLSGDFGVDRIRGSIGIDGTGQNSQGSATLMPKVFNFASQTTVYLNVAINASGVASHPIDGALRAVRIR